MSEQIKQLDAWVKIWKYEYFNLWNVTFQTLAKNNIIPKKDYWNYNNKRPDWLLVDRTNKKNPRVIGVVEYKSWEKFQKERDIEEAVQQCNNYVQVLWGIFGVSTDTNISVWINPNQENKENEYIDNFGNIRSYSFIKDEEKQKLSHNFYLHLQKTDCDNEEHLKDEVKETYKIIKRILDSDIWKNNSELKDTIFVDPTNLAKSVWQDIYVATWKEPEKCLYNVVELFIFKFLSDLWVLQSIYSFNFLIEMVNKKDFDEDILKHYANTIRQKIKKELFPADSEDGTTIMNWTIFVNEKNEPVPEFATLFVKSLKRYNDFWDLTNVEKSFKTKLYETFLKRDSGVKWMWQFFTPRKVISNIVEMAKVEKLGNWARVCDPFCWVWGFPLEVIAKRKNKDFVIKNNSISQKIEYFGFDKWSSEKDSERTIILAKANMLIYLSELIKEYPNLTKEFSNIFNKTFKLKKWTLWTLADVWNKEDDKFDLIITNPPYVTAWSGILKEEIAKDQEKQDFYKTNWRWVETLATEWIIKKLKKWWRAFAIIPEWILSRWTEKSVRKLLIDECFINWIISLPTNTFFTTPQKTYILAITKKHSKDEKQRTSIFTYLVSDIWETLDVDRFNTWKSDLEKAKELFKLFDGNEEIFEKFNNDPRCKIQSIERLIEKVEDNWAIDRRWSKEEKIELWIEEQEEIWNLEDFILRISDLKEKISSIENNIKQLTIKESDFQEFKLEEIIDFSQNTNSSKFTKAFINDNKWEIPVFSATKDEKVVWYWYVKDNLEWVKYFENCLTWNIDWSIWYVFYRKWRFSLSEKVIPLILFKKYKDKIDENYLKYLLQISSKERGFSYSNKAWKWKIKDIWVPFPLNEKWELDIRKQREIANKYKKIDEIKEELEYLFDNIKNLQVII